MNQKLSFITLGVQDLLKAKTFYTEKFGWSPLKDSDGIVFFKLNGIILGLFPVQELANDAGVANDGKGFKRFSMAINLNSEKEVDEAFENLKRKGVTIIKSPQKVF